MDDLLAKARGFMHDANPSRKLMLLLIGLVAAAAIVINSLGGEKPRVIRSPNPTTSDFGQASVNTPSFFVHIVGRVKTPGVYSLNVGSRLFDAVVAAGGFLPDADQGSVNLARQLTDGEQVIVLKVGVAGASGAIVSGAGAGAGLVSLNRGTEAELESLPGVGPALAGRIIDWRQANGGFKRKEDLLQVGGIGDKLFGGLSKLISL
jgi:competence protein ComEA